MHLRSSGLDLCLNFTKKLSVDGTVIISIVTCIPLNKSVLLLCSQDGFKIFEIFISTCLPFGSCFDDLFSVIKVPETVDSLVTEQ